MGIYGFLRRQRRRKILLSTRFNGIFRPQGGGSIARFSPRGGRLQGSGRKVLTCIPDSNIIKIIQLIEGYDVLNRH